MNFYLPKLILFNLKEILKSKEISDQSISELQKAIKEKDDKIADVSSTLDKVNEEKTRLRDEINLLNDLKIVSEILKKFGFF